MKQTLLERICPHRGIGDENTLAAIENGLLLQPFLLEFDVQYHHQNLYLGHPPGMAREATLQEALELFAGQTSLPKVDLKLTERTVFVGLWAFITAIDKLPFSVLVNISGDLQPQAYMKAEQVLMKSTPATVLLNIDLARYGKLSVAQIDAHLSSLARKPFSISPNLEAPLYMVESLARRHDIQHIHFWSHPASSYPVATLEEKLDDLQRKNFEVCFDIKQQNIMTRRRPLTPLAI